MLAAALAPPDPFGPAMQCCLEGAPYDHCAQNGASRATSNNVAKLWQTMKLSWRTQGLIRQSSNGHERVQALALPTRPSH